MIYLGDCLEIMPRFESESVDMIFCDLPYGITKNRWDTIIPFEPLWLEYWRVLKPTGVICLTACQPFTSTLIVSETRYFKHEWIWIKNKGSNFANTVREPMREHESILVFSRGKWTYNKQMQERTGGGASRAKYADRACNTTSTNYTSKGFKGKRNPRSKLRVPSSWQKFNTCTSRLHPTQKPLALVEYMIKTYTHAGDLVLDNACGSGTTGVAAKNLGRDYILIEKDPAYFEIAKKRLAEKPKQKSLFG